MNSVINWLKNNWLLVLLIGAVIFMIGRQFYSENLYDSLMDDYNKQAEEFRKEIVELEKINNDFIKKQKELNNKHEKELERIENEYHLNLESITRQQSKKRNKIIRRAQEDPTTLTKQIEETFLIPVVP